MCQDYLGLVDADDGLVGSDGQPHACEHRPYLERIRIGRIGDWKGDWMETKSFCFLLFRKGTMTWKNLENYHSKDCPNDAYNTDLWRGQTVDRAEEDVGSTGQFLGQLRGGHLKARFQYVGPIRGHI